MNRNTSSHRLAMVLGYVTLMAAIAQPLIAAIIWLMWDRLAPMAADNLQHVFDVTGLGPGARLAGFGLFLIGALIRAYGLLGLRRTFLEAARGQSLSEASVNGFRRFAWVSLVMVFFGVLQHTGLIVILSLSDPAHKGMLSIQFGSAEISALFMALLLVFVGHVFADGKLAREENEAFL